MIINSCSFERDFNLSYLQGFIHALSICCIDTNVCTYFEVYEIENYGDIEVSIYETRKENIEKESKNYLGQYSIDDLSECHKRQYKEIVEISANEVEINTFFQKVKNSFWLTDMKNGELLLSEFIECLKSYSNPLTAFEIQFYDGNYGGGRFALKSSDKYLIISIVYND